VIRAGRNPFRAVQGTMRNGGTRSAAAWITGTAPHGTRISPKCPADLFGRGIQALHAAQARLGARGQLSGALPSRVQPRDCLVEQDADPSHQSGGGYELGQVNSASVRSKRTVRGQGVSWRGLRRKRRPCRGSAVLLARAAHE
jgi:hypothetical protein